MISSIKTWSIRLLIAFFLYIVIKAISLVYLYNNEKTVNKDSVENLQNVVATNICIGIKENSNASCRVVEKGIYIKSATANIQNSKELCDYIVEYEDINLLGLDQEWEVHAMDNSNNVLHTCNFR